MYIVPSSEALVETKICRHCNGSFPITDKDLEFYDKISPIFAGVKCSIPTPTLCPDCRNQRRLSWRNRRKMYRRKCNATGKDIVSMFRPDTDYKVYHTKVWESDTWNPKDYGKDFDFSRNFFEQYDDLLKKVPLPHLAIIESSLENSEYVNGANGAKNCYLSNNIVNVESVYYSEDVYETSNCIDSLSLRNSQECYECTSSNSLYGCRNVFGSESCRDCAYCSYCRSCHNCTGCINLINQEYCLFNAQYTKEEYFERISEMSDSQIQEGMSDLAKKVPFKSINITNSNDVIGDTIYFSEHCHNVFDIYECEYIRYSTFVTGNSKDCCDITYWGQQISLCYEWTAVGLNSDNILFSCETYENMSQCLYCYFCYPNSSNLFGCIGIKNSQYCILNKQYTKEEYEALVPRIIAHMRKTGEWGEFFPSSISPFGYNETVASEFYPLDRDSAQKDSRFKWSDYEAPFPKVEKIIPAAKLPESIAQVPDDILNWAVECEETGKPFRIVKPELEFYRKHGIPIPHKHPDARHKARMTQKNPRTLFERKCHKCQSLITTTYSPERPEIVYCEECYNAEIS